MRLTRKQIQRLNLKLLRSFDGDLSSFGPKTVFDNLVFLRFNLSDNQLYIYDLQINSEQFGKYPANKTQTIQDQKDEGRRPHVSLLKLFCRSKKLRTRYYF